MTLQQKGHRERPAVPEYHESLKSQVGLWLLTAPRGTQKIVSRSLEVTDRTLRSWKKKAKVEARGEVRRGRKPGKLDLFMQIKIGREWQKQGYPGSRPVEKALRDVPIRQVRQVIAAIKRRKEERYQAHRKRVRVRIKVVKPNVVVTMDGASPESGDFVVVRDRADLSVNATACESHLASKDTIQVLNKLKSKDDLPLVVGTDNGSPFCSEAVKDYLKEHKIIHLKSLPYVPQHNGSCENAVKEFKTLIGKYRLGPEEACRRLNEGRLRASLSWQTSCQYRKEKQKPWSREAREEFYDAATKAIRESQAGTKSVYEKRKAEREAIFQTLENFELITRTRGSPSRSVKAEEIT